MGNDSREFKIRITTDAGSAVTSIKQTESALTDVSKATDKAGTAAHEASKGVEKLELSHREQTEALRLAIPGIGEYARVLTHLSGPAGPVLIAAIAIGRLAESLQEFDKQMDEAAKVAAEPTFAEGCVAIAEAMNKAAEAASKYIGKLADLNTESQKYADEQERITKAMEARMSAEEKAEKAQHDLALANVAAQEKAGKLTPQQAAQAHFEIEAYYANRDANKENRHDEARLDDLERQRQARIGRTGGLSAAAQSAAAREGEAGVAVASDTARYAELGEAAKKMEAIVALFETLGSKTADISEIAKARSTLQAQGWLGLAPSPQDEEEARTRAEDSLRGAKQKMIEIGGPTGKTGRLHEEIEAAAQAHEDAEKARAADLENLKAIEDLKKQILDLVAVISARTPASNAAAAAERFGRDSAAPGAEDITRAAQIAQAEALHQKVSDADDAFLKAFEATMRKKGLTTERMLNLMYELVGKDTTMEERIRVLEELIKYNSRSMN